MAWTWKTQALRYPQSGEGSLEPAMETMWLVEHLDIMCAFLALSRRIFGLWYSGYSQSPTQLCWYLILFPHSERINHRQRDGLETGTQTRHSLQWFLMLVNYPSGILITSSIHLFFRNHCSPFSSPLSSHSNKMRERVNNTPHALYALPHLSLLTLR